MSINRDMSRYTIQEEKRVRSPSGGFKTEWVHVSNADVAVYKNDEYVTHASEVYKVSTHTGLTYRKGLRAGKHLLKNDDAVYMIMSSNDSGRLASLLLKEVTTDVG